MKEKIIKIKMYFTFFLFLVSLSQVFADSIERDKFDFLIDSIESYINNQKIISSESIILFDCKRDSRYHNGYKKSLHGIDITKYPYIVIKDGKNTTTKNTYIIEISFEEKNKDIIINLLINGKWYGFYSSVHLVNGRKVILNRPGVLFEND